MTTTTAAPEKLTVRPMGARVLIKRGDPLGQSKGGIILPNVAQRIPTEGTVTAVGEKVLDLEVGDRVLFQEYAGTELTVEDDRFLIVEEKEVLGILERRALRDPVLVGAHLLSQTSPISRKVLEALRDLDLPAVLAGGSEEVHALNRIGQVLDDWLHAELEDGEGVL